MGDEAVAVAVAVEPTGEIFGDEPESGDFCIAVSVLVLYMLVVCVLCVVFIDVCCLL